MRNQVRIHLTLLPKQPSRQLVRMGRKKPRGQRLRRQQVEWVETDCFGVAFDGGQGEVAFAAFDAADVGAVHTDQLGESFLGEPFGLAVGAEILADDALKVSDCHVPKAHGVLLENLQTYK